MSLFYFVLRYQTKIPVTIIPLSGHVISSEAWQDLVRTHPDFLVEIQDCHSTTARPDFSILSPAIPLYKLEFAY